MPLNLTLPAVDLLNLAYDTLDFSDLPMWHASDSQLAMTFSDLLWREIALHVTVACSWVKSHSMTGALHRFQGIIASVYQVPISSGVFHLNQIMYCSRGRRVRPDSLVHCRNMLVLSVPLCVTAMFHMCNVLPRSLGGLLLEATQRVGRIERAWDHKAQALWGD